MKKYANIGALSGLLFVSFGALGVLLSLQEKLGSILRIGPGFIPLVVSSLLVLLGSLVFMRGCMASGDDFSLGSLRPPMMIVCSVAAFALCVRGLGLFPATFAAVFLACYAAPSPRIVEVVLLALGLSVFCSAVFIWGLGLTVPVLFR